MRNDTLVIVEWYDTFIPPRCHMSVVSYAAALAGVRSGYTLRIWPIDPRLSATTKPVGEGG